MVAPASVHGDDGRPKAMITGASSGIGKAVSLGLAQAGWRTTLVARDTPALAGAAEEIDRETGGQRSCDIAPLDLSDLAAVRQAGACRRDKGQPLDLLVCNAAVMAPPLRRTGKEGHELQLTVNHLAHYVLAAKLMPVLRLSAAGRIVWVSSIRHHNAPRSEESPWSPCHYDGAASYATSKAWNLAFCLWLDNRLAGDTSGLRSVAAHPGWSRTGLQRGGPAMDGGSIGGRLQASATRMLAQPARWGARPVLEAALGTLPDKPTYLGPNWPGELWGNRAAAAKISRFAADDRIQGWVAAMSAELTLTSLPG